MRKRIIMKYQRKVYAKMQEGIMTTVISSVFAHKIKEEMNVIAAQIKENALKELKKKGQ